MRGFPKVAAASSGAVEGRDGENYRIRLRVSQAAPSQTYVIIELQDPASAAPSTILLGKPDGEYDVHALPEPDVPRPATATLDRGGPEAGWGAPFTIYASN